MKYTFTALALAALSFANPVPETYSAPPTFKITSVASGGSGCPQGSIDIKWTDNRILPIYFNKDFTARVGSKTDVADSRKNCQINLALAFSPGYSFAIFSADYAGWGDLDNGVTGVVKSTYYFSGEQDQSSTTATLSGPWHGQYFKSDKVALSYWSPCGSDAMLNVNSEIALTPFATPLSGTLAATREGAQFSSTLNIQWRKC
ncbi:Nn.00g073340.m01.CDS01 [Neocucurbitaria sp. VM-36]